MRAVAEARGLTEPNQLMLRSARIMKVRTSVSSMNIMRVAHRRGESNRLTPPCFKHFGRDHEGLREHDACRDFHDPQQMITSKWY